MTPDGTGADMGAPAGVGTGDGLPVRPPPVMDRDSRPWWEALARHELLLQRCASCRAWRWPARAMCGRCGSFEWAWTPASGSATVASWVVNHHRFSADIASPYVVVTVRLDEQDDLLLPGAWEQPPMPPDSAPRAVDAGLSIGVPVTARYLDCAGTDGSAFTLLGWTLAPGP